MEAASAVAGDALKKEASGPFASRMEALSVKVKSRVEVLQDIQRQHDELEAKFNAEKAALIAKYDKLYEPLYSKRADIVNGVIEVEEVAAKAPAAEPPSGEEKEEKGVPEFWLTAMKTNEIVASEITERDEGALKYLKDIKSVNLDELKGFRLEFYFHPNPYFKNEVLTKTYQMVDENDILEHATGTVIDWLPGKNLTQKLMKKKPKKGTKSAGPPVTKIEECDSFFNFFSPPQIPENEEDMDEEEAEELQDIMEQDYDVGTAIKDKIIPHAVSWYTGEAVEGEEYEDDTEEDEDENEDEEEEDEDDEDDEDEGSHPKLVKKGSKQKEAGQPPECKQQ